MTSGGTHVQAQVTFAAVNNNGTLYPRTRDVPHSVGLVQFLVIVIFQLKEIINLIYNIIIEKQYGHCKLKRRAWRSNERKF